LLAIFVDSELINQRTVHFLFQVCLNADSVQHVNVPNTMTHL